MIDSTRRIQISIESHKPKNYWAKPWSMSLNYT